MRRQAGWVRWAALLPLCSRAANNRCLFCLRCNKNQHLPAYLRLQLLIPPGVLLVASEGLHHSVFRRSVVLLTAHGRWAAMCPAVPLPCCATAHALLRHYHPCPAVPTARALPAL